MKRTQRLHVGEVINAGFGEFRPVTVFQNVMSFGVDAHLGRGRMDERRDRRKPYAASPVATEADRELIDWQDGNGLLSHDLATEAEVWTAVKAAEAADDPPVFGTTWRNEHNGNEYRNVVTNADEALLALAKGATKFTLFDSATSNCLLTWPDATADDIATALAELRASEDYVLVASAD
jgi:hypothetical protein